MSLSSCVALPRTLGVTVTLRFPSLLSQCQIDVSGLVASVKIGASILAPSSFSAYSNRSHRKKSRFRCRTGNSPAHSFFLAVTVAGTGKASDAAIPEKSSSVCMAWRFCTRCLICSTFSKSASLALILFPQKLLLYVLMTFEVMTLLRHAVKFQAILFLQKSSTTLVPPAFECWHPLTQPIGEGAPNQSDSDAQSRKLCPPCHVHVR